MMLFSCSQVCLPYHYFSFVADSVTSLLTAFSQLIHKYITFGLAQLLA